ncbi:MAG: hypothetical protein AMXMBFR64_03660 [Myxococcales bacterium]
MKSRWLVLVVLAACASEEQAPATLAEGIFATAGEVLPSATAEERATFERGRAVATRHFAPSEGLGPSFNVTLCTGCHEKPVVGGGAPRYRNFLLQQSRQADGSQIPVGKNGVQTQFDMELGRTPTDPAANVTATRNPIPFFGTGLLAEIPEEEILRYADPDDADGDGISGRPNYDRGFVGRFGVKAQTVSIEGFIRGPLFNHLGITTVPLSNERKAALPVPSAAPSFKQGALGVIEAAQAAAPDEPTTDEDGVADPELSEQDLFDLVAFSMLLAAPEPDAPTAASERGRGRFEELGCAACHVPALDGPRGLIPAYSDLLLHDMGEELADGIVMGVATGSEFRTQPLWGVAATGPYLHDGRADTLDEAVRAHGGEAAASRDAYVGLNDGERGEVIAFLESLGGRAQRSSGLLPPEAPVPAVGEYGGPRRALAGDDVGRFAAGREVFDRDMPASGLGPRFNGDSCRACHSAPTIGGASGLDLNVMRQAIRHGDGTTLEPPMGTMAHRFSVSAEERPPVDPECNVFEWRQTPHTFGLGLIDAIDEATIVGGEDPDDSDGDGVKGRAHRLADGRIGRFGWKANVPSVEEFLRDAMTNEVGLSVPAREGQSFGATKDEDGAADPELIGVDYDAILFFLRELAPPPRGAGGAELATGEQVFETIGCAACHTPSLPAADGTPVPLYSNLLLHDVAAPDAVGVPAGDAGPREFRTPPLWGVGQTAPYMHSGRAETLEQAIDMHDTEGAKSRDAFTALDAQDKDALLAFLRSL